jgi:hypothetical protein
METTKLYVEHIIIGVLSLISLLVIVDLVLYFAQSGYVPILSRDGLNFIFNNTSLGSISGFQLLLMFAFLVVFYVSGALSSRLIKVALRYLVEDKSIRYRYQELYQEFIPGEIKDAFNRLGRNSKRDIYNYVRTCVMYGSPTIVELVSYDRSIIRLMRGSFANLVLLTLFGGLHVMFINKSPVVVVLVLVCSGIILSAASYRSWRDITSEYHRQIAFAYVVMQEKRYLDKPASTGTGATSSRSSKGS